MCLPSWQAQQPSTSGKGEAEANALTPSPGDLWVKVEGREPERPGESQQQTVAGTKPGALEHPFQLRQEPVLWMKELLSTWPARPGHGIFHIPRNPR